MSTTAHRPSREKSRWEAQRSFDELGRPLRDLTFCVVDLETTGGSAAAGSMITEIGAVKVRGGEVLGEFQTLVDPHTEIPAFIAVLTGISNSMVRDAPPIEAALPAFLDFAAGCVLVAHNAPFDVGFLQHFARQQGRPWPKFEVLDTAKLARRVITRDDAPNCKLSSLAKVFNSTTTPNHRALSDARATVDVLHGLMERLGGVGVHTLEELQTFTGRVSTAQRRKRHLAEGLPHSPGVYLFRDDRQRVLYVGTSKDLRTRVRTYFTASETRSRMGEMVNLAVEVTAIECATALEAEVRELRLLAGHAPRYNRRSRFPHRGWWVALTDEPFPRLSVVRTPRADAIGPFTRRPDAVRAVEALQDAVPLRPCTQRIPARGAAGTPCALHEMRRCDAPCAGHVDVEAYRPVVDDARALVRGADDAGLRRLSLTVTELAAAERFEDAAAHRDRLADLAAALGRVQRLSAVAAAPEMIAARPDGERGWDLAVVRHGRLAAAGRARRGVPPMPVVEALVASAETVRPGDGPLRGAPPEEVAVVTRWLERPGTRMVRTTTPWAMPAASAGAWREWVGRAREARHAEHVGAPDEPP
ncbi:MAG TPA: DEDD exonuclease domain-containing protein [Actinomycetospora sp.]|nr:DEDD exonuclease domain-containing protein [Actinomycetospora sp.]